MVNKIIIGMHQSCQGATPFHGNVLLFCLTSVLPQIMQLYFIRVTGINMTNVWRSKLISVIQEEDNKRT